MKRSTAKQLLKNKIQTQNPNLSVAINFRESGETIFPSGLKGWYAKGEALGINKITGNSEKVSFVFTTQGNNWTATLQAV